VESSTHTIPYPSHPIPSHPQNSWGVFPELCSLHVLFHCAPYPQTKLFSYPCLFFVHLCLVSSFICSVLYLLIFCLATFLNCLLTKLYFVWRASQWEEAFKGPNSQAVNPFLINFQYSTELGFVCGSSHWQWRICFSTCLRTWWVVGASVAGKIINLA